MRTIRSWVLRLINPGYAHCEKCGIPWNHCKSKSVKTSSNTGTFATCQTCWDSSTIGQLRGYYEAVYRKQEKSIRGSEYAMEHTLAHLLRCVEQELINEINNKLV